MESRGIAPVFLSSELDGGDWSTTRPGRYTHRERPPPGTNSIAGWVSPRAGLDDVERRKISYLCWESKPGRPAHSPSLYRLSDLCSQVKYE
jgi:hypothetical protein